MALVNSNTGEIVGRGSALPTVLSDTAKLRGELLAVGDSAGMADLARRADGIADLAKRAFGHTADAQPFIAEAIRCRWAYAQLIGPNPPAGGDRRSSDFVSLEGDGLTQKQRERWRKLHAIPETQLEELLQPGDDDSVVTLAEVLKKFYGAHVGNNSGENEWYTPLEYIAAARVVLGDIDLDPASSETANAVVGATSFYTEADNGLEQMWKGTVWMNPPYESGLIDKFARKLADDYRDGSVTAAVVLVNNATETGWFHVLAQRASAMCFPKGRIKFWNPDKATAAPLQGQAVIYLGRNIKRFRSEFETFGFTVAL